jgi:PAS domain S-box-containing protein
MLGHSLPMYAGRSLVARAARSGEPVVVNNTREDPNHLPNPLLPDTASEVAIPLIAGDRTIGVLDIQQNTAYHFDEEEIQTLQIVANQLAVAIANAEFFQAVEEARSSYALLAENATDVISRHELHGQFTYVSPAASNLLGYTSAELLEMSIFDMMHHDDLARFGFEERSLFEERDVVNIEYRIQRKDEEYIWFETTARAVRDSKGEVVDMVAVSRDVTDRVIARQRQETAYELAQELSTSLDIDMLLERTVNQLADAFGLYHAHVYLLEDDALVVREGLGMAGQQLKQLGHSIPVDAARSVVARSARSRDPVVIDDVMADPTHLPNPLLPRTRSELALPLNVGDDLLGVLDVQHDVEGYFTQDVIQTLAIVSNQLSVALSNANLYQQQIETAERLREVDQLKSEFLATMSHELRTPLNSIIGYSELLIDELTEDLDEMSMEDLQAIHSSGHHLLAIINDILDIAKIESGRMEINRTELDVADFVQQVADMTRVQLRDRASVEMLIEMPDDLPPILADSVRMRQMMLNLTGNAAKFTEEGHIMIRVEMDDTWMYLKVVDTGTGIPEDAQDKVFDRFSQADSSATRKAGGTGLGLTVSRQLAQLHGGDLYLEESTPGEGSTFTLKMPLDAPAETQRADRANLATEEISAD